MNRYTGSLKVPDSFDVIKKSWECRRQYDLFLSLAISALMCGIITVGFPFFLKGVLSLLLPSGEIIRRKYREQIGGSKRKLFLWSSGIYVQYKLGKQEVFCKSQKNGCVVCAVILGTAFFRQRNVGIKINIFSSALEHALYLVYVGVCAANQWERLSRGQA